MSAQSTSLAIVTPSNLLGLLAVALVALTLANVKLPLVGSPRAAVLALGAVGFLMCSTGALGKIIAAGGFTSPAFIAGSLLGLLALALALLVGLGVKLPWLPSERVTFLALAAIIAVKWVIALLSTTPRG